MKSRSVADEYADKLGDKFGGSRKGRQVGRMLGIDVPSGTQTAIAEGEKKRQPKLGALDIEEELEDYDDDEGDIYGIETEEERRERMDIYSEEAADAIDMLRRNIDEGEEQTEEMEEEDMIDAVAKAMEKANFVSSRDILRSTDDESSAETTSATSSSTTETPASVVSSTGKYVSSLALLT